MNLVRFWKLLKLVFLFTLTFMSFSSDGRKCFNLEERIVQPKLQIIMVYRMKGLNILGLFIHTELSAVSFTYTVTIRDTSHDAWISVDLIALLLQKNMRGVAQGSGLAQEKYFCLHDDHLEYFFSC